MKKILTVLLIGISVLTLANQITYGGQYYPGEFLLKGYDFFGEQGLDVNHILFSSGTENSIALISGSVDINVGSDSKTVALFNTMGDKALIIGVIQRGDRYSTVVKDPTIADWSQLKGKIVATRFGTGAEYVLRKYFDTRDDLKWEDFKWVNLNTEDMISTLAAGQIEAFTVWAPTGEIAVSQGVGTIMRSYGDIALTPVQIHTTKEFAETHREELIKFLMAHIKKSQMIKNNPELAARYAAQASKEMGIEVSEQAYKLIFERIDFSLEFDEKTLTAELTETAEFLKEQGKIKSIPEFYIDTSYLKEAMERIENE